MSATATSTSNNLMNWTQVHITDQAIEMWKTLHKALNVSDDAAFELLLTVLENAKKSVFVKQEENKYVYRLENYLLTIQDNKLIEVVKTRFPKELIYHIHYLEDGRCETCGQAMDKNVAKIRRVDKYVFCEMENYELVCTDCLAKRPNALSQARFSNLLVQQYADMQNISHEDALLELERYKKHFVLVKSAGKQVYKYGKQKRVKSGYRLYWMNQLGHFMYQNRILYTRKWSETIDPSPEPFPQRRSRNLSRI